MPGPRRRLRVPVRLTAAIGGLALVVSSGLLLGASPSPAAPSTYTFGGAGFGAIADGGSSCPTGGSPRDVTFNVTGVPQRTLGDVRITGLALAHSFVGDLTVTLIAPNGATRGLFARTGATTAGAFGDSSNLVGPYGFADTGTPTPGNWWAAALAAADTNAVVASGVYRASQSGGAGGTGAQELITSAFSGVTNPNGTWTLRFVDTCSSDTGSVTAATLEMTPVPANCTVQQAAVTTAQAKVTSTAAALTKATADKAAADQTVAQAAQGVKKAKAKVKKAKKALAKATGKAVAAAEKALAKAKAKLKKAKKKLKAAKAQAASAGQQAAAAQTASTSAKAELAQAQAALTACENS